MFIALLAAFVALFAVQDAVAQTCSRTYTVQEGDICDSISAANNASTYQVAAVNAGVINAQCTNLTPGTPICLGYIGQDCQTTYVVQLGDDCDWISANAGVNNTILYMNNPQINSECSNIYVGEVLCTAGIVQVPPTPSTPVAQPPPTAIPANPFGNGGNDLPWCD